MSELHFFKETVDENVFALIRTIFHCEVSVEEFGFNHFDICVKCESGDSKAIRKMVQAWS